MARSDELKAELKVAELEEKLAAAKKTKKGPDRKLKNDLREARRIVRMGREA